MKKRLLAPGDWTATGPLGAPWYLGVELEYTPGPQVETCTIIELAKRGIFVPGYQCYVVWSFTGGGQPSNCCIGMGRYAHIIGGLSQANDYQRHMLFNQAGLAQDEIDLLQQLTYSYADGEQASVARQFERDETLRQLLMRVFPNQKISDVRYPFNGWVLKSDPTCGMELVSPPLDMGKDECVQSVASACQAIKAAEGEANARCGLHVHVNTHQLSDQEVRRLFLWFRILEPFMILPTSTVRAERNTHSVPWMRKESMKPFESFISSRNENRNVKLAGLSKGHLARLTGHYGGLSTSAINNHGTIEIRLKEGTLEEDDVISWMLFVQRFVNAAVKTVPPLWPDYFPLEPTAKSIRMFLRWMKLWPTKSKFDKDLALWYIRSINKPTIHWARKRSIKFKELEEKGVFVSPDGRLMADLLLQDPSVMPIKLLLRVIRILAKDLDPTADTMFGDAYVLSILSQVPEDDDEAEQWMLKRSPALVLLADIEQEIRKVVREPQRSLGRTRSQDLLSHLPDDLANELVAFYS